MDLGTGGKGGKKPLDASINLVPFIDLMAVTIAFLIMSAVWTQLSRLQVSQAGQSASPDQTETPPQTLKPVSIKLTDKEMRVSFGEQQFDPYTITRDDKNRIDVTQLVAKLTELKGIESDQVAITLVTEDSVRYDDLVRIIDAAIGAKYPSISISPATG